MPTRAQPRRHVAASLLLALVGGAACGFFAVRTAPKKTAKASTSELAVRSKRMMRESLRGDRYDRLPEVLRDLTAAYLENPRDWEVSFLLGMAHLWRIAERTRVEREPGDRGTAGRPPKVDPPAVGSAGSAGANVPAELRRDQEVPAKRERDPRITDHMILADKYLSEARRLNPRDFRIAGFEGAVKIALGSIHEDERLKREGYFILRDGTRRYPEFNFFTMSFVLSNAPRGSKQFDQAVDYAWKNLEVCSRKKIGRTAAEVARLEQELSRTASREGEIPGGSPDRACRNPATVPHNMEGFLLHMGDLVVKQGDVETAQAVYRLARASPDYSEWPYAPVLEKRIEEAPARAEAFARGKNAEMMFNSRFACVGCHATREAKASALLR